MEETNLIECLVVKERQMFPKGRYYNDDGEYAIITFKVEEAIKGKPKRHPVYKTITVKGNMPSIKSGKVYHLLAQETYDENYKNYSYEVSYIGEKLSTMEDLDDIKTALEEVTSSKLANEIIKLDNIKNILESRDTEALKQIDGIGEVLSVKIMDKYHEKTKFGMYLIKLSKMGLTKNMLDALVKKYANYETIYNKIRMNPYMLADSVKGIGFLKADALAEKFGIAQNSPERIRAYVKHLLNEKANEGKSFLLTKEVLSSLRSQTDETKFPISRDLISETFNKMKDKKELWWNENKTVLALPTVREIEKEIAEHLMRIKEGEFVFDDSLIEENIRAIEKRKGFEYTDEQREGIYTVMNNQVVVITGYAGCVDCDTEFFNGKEWKRIADYQEGDMVLQYNLDGTANLTKPKSFVKKECEEMTLITNKSGRINQCLSDEHNVVYLTSKGNINKKPFYEVKKHHIESDAGFGGKIITTFNYSGEGIPLTEEMIRVKVMTYADGSFKMDRKQGRCVLNLKKERKKARARYLLQKANIPFIEKEGKDGYTRISYQMETTEKHYEDWWYNCTQNQLRIVCDEVLRWDGSVTKNRDRFSTTIRSDADFVQFAFSSIGRRATISVRDRVGEVYKDLKYTKYTRKSLEYDVHISKGSVALSLRGDKRRNFEDKARMETYKTTDGYKYCFEVESSMLVLRRNNRIFITGNTGKTSVLEPMTQILVEQQGRKIIQVALSGKASQRIQEVTGYEAKTIHRGLEFNPRLEGDGFLRNEQYPLDQDIVVLDEASMVDATLFRNLLRAIRTGTKLLILGDAGQLPNIGFGQVFFDLIECGIIPVVRLTKIHRQAQKSAVITESIKIREKGHIVNYEEDKDEVLGELQDLHLKISVEKDKLPEEVVKVFKERLEIEKDIMEVQVVGATRTRGNLSAFNLNNKIKELINPIDEDDSNYIESTVDSTHKYQISEGDKVIIVKNNYKVEVWNEENRNFTTGAIFNGNLGIVEKIGIGYVIVNIVGVGKVKIDEKHYNSIELGYAITISKSQGSGWRSVIVALDSSAYMLLCCELLYTAITRTISHCTLIGENKAIRRCCSVSNGSNKQTFLPSFLEQIKQEMNNSL